MHLRPRRAGHRPKLRIELVEKRCQVAVDDLLSTGDLFKMAIVSSPAHPLWLGAVISNATVRSELGLQFETATQCSIIRRFAL